MKALVVGLGAGGHAKVVIEAVRLEGRFEIFGLLDIDLKRQGSTVLGVPILGDDRLLPDYLSQGVRQFFVGLGSTGDMTARTRLYNQAIQIGLTPIDVIHPTAWVSPTARLGRGVTIAAGAVINTEAQLGENVIINTGAIIEHDCTIGAHTHVATGAKLAGGVSVGSGSHIGIGASVLQGRQIGGGVTVGAGAVVVNDVPDRVVVAGVPARILRYKDRNND